MAYISRRDFLTGLAGIALGLASVNSYSQDRPLPPGIADLGDPERWNKPVQNRKLSEDYTLDDFILALGEGAPGRWEKLTDYEKQRIAQTWNSADKRFRQKSCEIYFSPTDFVEKYFSKAQKQEFENWKRATYWLARDEYARRKKIPGAEGEVKIPLFRGDINIDALKEEYNQRYPWKVDLGGFKHNSGDTVLVFLYEQGKNRINPALKKPARNLPYK